MQPKSNALFHFTKSRETLKLMLKNGFWPRYCLEDVGWLGYDDYDYIAYPMVCFCEIPLSRIEDHVAFYGEFGLGLTREWAETNGLNPVLYIAGDNQVAKTLREIPDIADSMPEGDARHEALGKVRYLFAHAKPTSGKVLVDREPLEKLFYQESEWRYVPSSNEFDDFLWRKEFEDKANVGEQNELTRKNASLRFNPRDIRYIFVKADSDIPDIINFISIELDNIIAADQKILMSRVISLESLRHDI